MSKNQSFTKFRPFLFQFNPTSCTAIAAEGPDLRTSDKAPKTSESLLTINSAIKPNKHHTTGGGSKKVREAAVRSNRLTGRLDFFDTFLIKQKSMTGMI